MKTQVLLMFFAFFVSGMAFADIGDACRSDSQCCDGLNSCELYCSNTNLCEEKVNPSCSGVGAPCSSQSQCCGGMRCSAPTGITGYVCN